MEQKVKASPRIAPLPAEHTPELKDAFGAMKQNLGFVPNSMLILQRKPKIARALAQLTASIWEPGGEVERGFKRLVAHVASRAAGCGTEWSSEANGDAHASTAAYAVRNSSASAAIGGWSEAAASVPL